MQSVSRQIEIARLAGCIQVCQSEGDSVQLVGGYPAGVASLIESLQSSMAKRSNHDKIIPCAGTAINRISDLPHTDAVDSDKKSAACSSARHMAISNRRLLDALSRTPFVDSTELAVILGESLATAHRTLTGLLAGGIVGRVGHGTAHLPSRQRYHLPASSTLVMRWDLIAEYKASLAATTAGTDT